MKADIRSSVGLMLFLVVLAGVLPVLGIILASGLEYRQREIAQAEAESLALAESFAQQQDGVTKGVRQLLSTLSLIPEVQRHDALACTAIFKNLVSLNPSLANITLLAPSGDVSAAALGFSATSFAGQKHVKDVIRTREFSAGEYLVGRLSALPILAFGYPVQDDEGRLTGILTCSLNLDRFHQRFDNAQFPPGSVFVILDHQGTRLLYHPPHEATPIGVRLSPNVWAEYLGPQEQGVTRHVGSDKVLRRYAYQKLRLKPDAPPYMIMIVAVPEAQVLAKADALTLWYLRWLAVAALLSGLSAWLVGKYGLLDRMRRLTQAARRIGDGDLTARTGIAPGSGSLAQVAQAFDDMAQALSQRTAQMANAQQEATQARAVVQSIIDSMPSAIVGVDAAGRILHFNQAAARLSGVTAQAAIRMKLGQACPRLAGLGEHIRAAMASNAPVVLEKQRRRSQGEAIVEDISIYPLANSGLSGVVIRLDDVTQRERLAEIMVQTEKMMSVGGLAAGMAHEINNPLGGILQSAQVLERRLLQSSPANMDAALQAGCPLESVMAYMARRDVPALLGGIRQSGARASAIVSNMLEFSRSNDVRRSSVDVAQLLDKTLELASSDYDLKKMYDFKKIQIKRHYGPDVPLVVCSRSELEQVFLNLLKNAAQAMAMAPDMGREPAITLRTMREGPNVRVEIEDNGPGMAEDVRKRVFEPFFTTKEPGHGTGLGLSVSYFLVTHNHGGGLSVESEPGRGARFIIVLPANPLPA